MRDQDYVKGRTRVPPVPSGRLVVQEEGAVGRSHWLPAEGTAWTCPDCGGEFTRDEDRRGVPWRATRDGR